MQKITQADVAHKLLNTDGVIYNHSGTRFLITTKPETIETIQLSQKATLTTEEIFNSMFGTKLEPEQKKLLTNFANKTIQFKTWKYNNENYVFIKQLPVVGVSLTCFIIVGDYQKVNSKNNNLCMFGESTVPAGGVDVTGINLDNLTLFSFGSAADEISNFIEENFDLAAFAVKYDLTQFKNQIKYLQEIIQNFMPLCEKTKTFIEGSASLKIPSMNSRISDSMKKITDNTKTVEELAELREKIVADELAKIIDSIANELIISPSTVQYFIDQNYVKPYCELDFHDKDKLEVWKHNQINGIENTGGLNSEISTLEALIKSLEQSVSNPVSKTKEDISKFTIVETDISTSKLNSLFLKDTVFYFCIAFNKDFTNIAENYKNTDSETQIIPWKEFFGGNQGSDDKIVILWLPIIFISEEKSNNNEFKKVGGFGKTQNSQMNGLKMLTYNTKTWMNDIIFFGSENGTKTLSNNETIKSLLSKMVALVLKKKYNEHTLSFENEGEELQNKTNFIEAQFKPNSTEDLQTSTKKNYKLNQRQNIAGSSQIQSTESVFLENYANRKNHILISLSNKEFGFNAIQRYFSGYQPQFEFIQNKIFENKMIDFIDLTKISKPHQSHLIKDASTVLQSWLNTFDSEQNKTNSFYYTQKTGSAQLAFKSNDDIIKKALLMLPMILNALDKDEILLEDLFRKKVSTSFVKDKKGK